MDTTRFSTADAGFPLRRMWSRVSFRSDSGIGFDVGFKSVSGFTFTHKGWIDVHHPCDGHIKARLRMSVPTELVNLAPLIEAAQPDAPRDANGFDALKEILRTVFDALAIPADETYEATFFQAGIGIEPENATNRDGETDRFYSY